MVDSKIEEYIKQICSFVKFKKAHKEIQAEFLNHIDEKTEDLISKGFTEEEAAKKALIEMGDAEIIGKQLNQSHKAFPEWSILLITLLFSLLGVILVYFMIQNKTIFLTSAFKKGLIFNIIGYITIIILYFFDYKKLEKHSGKLFITATLILLLQFLLADTINGVKDSIHLNASFGAFTLNATELSLFLYVISLSKLLRALDFKNLKGYACLTIMLFLPIMLYAKLGSSIGMLTYIIIYIVLMLKAKINLPYILSVISIFVAGSINLVLSRPYILKRILIFIHSQNDPNGSGYIYVQIRKLLSSTGLLGNGFSLSDQALPAAQSEFVLPYIIYTFGWIAGILLIIMVIVFLLRMFTAANSVKDIYGRFIIQGFTCIFAIEFVWNILMVFGFLPYVGIMLPFISNGGSKLLVQMAAIGLIMSIYKCRSLSFSCE